MKRSDERILTTHVGSIMRPQAMLSLANSDDRAAQGLPQEYARVLRVAVAEVVKAQAAAGVDIVNDGEFGKSSWANYVLERVSGFERRPGEKAPLDWLGSDRDRFPEVVAERVQAHAGHDLEIRLHQRDRLQPWRPSAATSTICKRRWQRPRAAEGFITAVAPASGVFNATNEFYASEREYMFALAEALREEYLQLPGRVDRAGGRCRARQHVRLPGEAEPADVSQMGRAAHRGSQPRAA